MVGVRSEQDGIAQLAESIHGRGSGVRHRAVNADAILAKLDGHGSKRQHAVRAPDLPYTAEPRDGLPIGARKAMLSGSVHVQYFGSCVRYGLREAPTLASAPRGGGRK